MEKNNPLLWTMALGALASSNAMAQVDITSQIANAGFESDLTTGWKNNGFTHGTSDTFPGKVGKGYCEKQAEKGLLLPNAEISQEIKLPVGSYTLSAIGRLIDSTGVAVDGFILYAGDKSVELKEGKELSVISDIKITTPGQTLKIGAKLVDAKGQLAQLDGIKLMLSQESLTEAQNELTQKLAIVINKTEAVETDEFIQAILLEASNMQVKINEMTFAEYEAYKNNSEGNLADQINELSKDVENLVLNKKQYDAAKEAYATLAPSKNALDAAYNASDKAFKEQYDAAIANYKQFLDDIEAAYKEQKAGTAFTTAIINERVKGITENFTTLKEAIETGNTNLADYTIVQGWVDNAMVIYNTESSTLYNELSNQWNETYGDWYTQAILELNKAKKNIEAVEAANLAGKNESDETKNATALKNKHYQALNNAVVEMQAIREKWVADASKLKGYYNNACNDIEALQNSLDQLFSDEAPKKNFDVTAIETAINALQNNVDAAHKAHNIKAQAPYCNGYNEAKVAIEKQISELSVVVAEYKANNLTVKAINALQAGFTDAKKQVNALVSEDKVYEANGKYTDVEEVIQKEITAYEEGAKKAYGEKKAVAYQAQLNVSGTESKIQQYVEQANAAIVRYNAASTSIKAHEAALKELVKKVADVTVTVGGSVDGTETYEDCIKAIEAEITLNKTNLTAACNTTKAHYNAMMGFVMKTTSIDRAETLMNAYEGDEAKWNAAQQEAAKEKMLTEAYSRLDARAEDINKLKSSVYTAAEYGKGADKLDSTRLAIIDLYQVAVDDVHAAQALEPAEAISMLVTTTKNIATIETEIDKLIVAAADVKKEFDAETATKKALITEIEKIEAVIAKVATLNEDPNKDSAFGEEAQKLQVVADELEADVLASYQNETVREDSKDKKVDDKVVPGYDSRVQALSSEANKLTESAKAATTNWKAYVATKDTVDSFNFNDVIAKAKADIDATTNNAAQEHYLSIVNTQEKSVAKLFEDIDAAYAKGNAAAQQDALANRGKDLLAAITNVPKDADANEKAKNEQNSTLAKAKEYLGNVRLEISSSVEINSEELKRYMTELSELDATLSEIEANIYNSWSKGTSVADNTKYTGDMTAVNNKVKELSSSWTNDYNAEVAAYNLETKTAFDKKHTELQNVYRDAVELITEISKTKYAADFIAQLEEVTGENGIYTYAAKIRSLKAEADAAYTATEVGTIFDENKAYEATATRYQNEIKALQDAYTNAVNQYAETVYTTAYNKANQAYQNAANAIANFDETIKNTALLEVKTTLDNAQAAKEHANFAVQLDGILLAFDLVESKLQTAKEQAAKSQYELTIEFADKLYASESEAIAKFHNANGSTGVYAEQYEELYANTVVVSKDFYATIAEGEYFDHVTNDVYAMLSDFMGSIREVEEQSHTAIYERAYNEDKAYHANDVAYNEMLEAAESVQVELDALKEYVATLLIAHNEDANAIIKVRQRNIDLIIRDINKSHRSGTSQSEQASINERLEVISNQINGQDYKAIVGYESDAIKAAIAVLKHDYDLATANNIEDSSLDGYKTIIDAYATANNSYRSLFVDGTVGEDGKLVYASKEETHANYVELENRIGETRADLAAYYDAKLVESTLADLESAIAAVEADYTAIVAVLADCHAPVVENFATAVEEMKAAIDGERSHIAADTESILLHADNHKADIEAIAAKYESLKEKIENAEIPYDENDENYARLTKELNDLQAALDKVYAESENYEYQRLYWVDDVETTYREYRYAYIMQFIESDRGVAENKNASGVGLNDLSELAYKDRVTNWTAQLEKQLAYYNADQTYQSVERTFYAAYNLFYSSRYSTNDWNLLYDTMSSIYYALNYLREYNDAANNGFIDYDINGNILEDGGEAIEYMTAYPEVMAKIVEMSVAIEQFAADVEAKNYELGDIDHSGRVDVVDYSYIRNIVLGVVEVEAESPEFYAANVNNKDAEINIGDVTKIANYIMTGDFDGQGSFTARMRNYAAKNNNDALTVETEGNGSMQRIVISLDNSVAYVGAQMDIKLPAGVTIVNEQLTSRADGHELLSNDINGVHRIVVSSIDNNALMNTEKALIYIDVEVSSEFTGGVVEISNAIFADATARTYRLAGVATGDATGISELGVGEKITKKIYSVGGQMLNSLRKGINVIVNSDGTTKKVLKK